MRICDGFDSVLEAFEDFKFFYVVAGIRIDNNLLSNCFFEVDNQSTLFSVQKFSDLGIDLEGQTRTGGILAFAQKITINVIANGLFGYEVAFSFAVVTGLTEHAGQWLFVPFAGHLNQSHLGHGQNMGLAAIFVAGLLELVKDFFLVLFFLHIDEIDNDDATDVPQTHLVGYFPDGFEIGLHDRFFEIVFSHVPAGIHIDGHEGFGVFDHNIAAGFQPHLLFHGS